MKLAATCTAFVACFGSIWTLLGFLYGIAPMHVLGGVLLAPSTLVLLAIWALSPRWGQDALQERIALGCLGGTWGTIGYDWIRFPLHAAGFNPFAPIRSYGMFLLDAPHATWLSDLAGALYHFSNGISFGILYALVMSGRHWGWAIVWGLVLETLAFTTVYGDIYGLRSAPIVLAIAYFAHIYYGLPLGVIVSAPERARTIWRARASARVGTVVAAGGTILALSLLWGPPISLPAATLRLGPEQIQPGWVRVDVSQPLSLQNATSEPLGVRVGNATHALQPGQTQAVSFEGPGIVQVAVDGPAWRSAFVAVERQGRLK